MPGISSDTRTQQGRRTPLRLLFGAAVTGLAAFVGTFLVEGAVRPGYRPWRHAVSQLSLGPFGWVNTIAILVAAAALLAFAVGLGRAVPAGTGSTWGPRLMAVAGVCFGLLAIFPDDPALGYPPGSHAQRSLPGLVHGLAGTVTFGCLSAACLVMARRFAGDPAGRGWARYSLATGLVVAIGYVTTAVLTGLDDAGVLPNAPGGLVQRAMIITGFGWVVLLALLPRRWNHEVRGPPGRPSRSDRSGRRPDRASGPAESSQARCRPSSFRWAGPACGRRPAGRVGPWSCVTAVLA
jgi:Protein of unknown function (DUF998)